MLFLLSTFLKLLLAPAIHMLCVKRATSPQPSLGGQIQYPTSSLCALELSCLRIFSFSCVLPDISVKAAAGSLQLMGTGVIGLPELSSCSSRGQYWEVFCMAPHRGTTWLSHIAKLPLRTHFWPCPSLPFPTPHLCLVGPLPLYLSPSCCFGDLQIKTDAWAIVEQNCDWEEQQYLGGHKA